MINQDFLRGYKDGQEGTPTKRAPTKDPEVLYLHATAAPDEVNRYWEGWEAGIKDNILNAGEARK